MSNDPNTNHHVRRVVLPSGKTIEVVYFEDQVDHGATHVPPTIPQRRTGDDQRELHVCTECTSDLVYPLDWDESGPTHWDVSLRCPNCEWTGTGRFAQTCVEAFDEQLDRGTEALVRDLKRLVHANMEEEIGRFVEALGDDHILPSDF
jgi:hypothetical protein